jgi:hypothetical protein
MTSTQPAIQLLRGCILHWNLDLQHWSENGRLLAAPREVLRFEEIPTKQDTAIVPVIENNPANALHCLIYLFKQQLIMNDPRSYTAVHAMQSLTDVVAAQKGAIA